jgi:tRNA-2-methylthio-N6-dimethylallyladenosine synthase
MKQKVFFKTFGCQMNIADSEYVASLLLSDGNYELTQNINEADIIIVNTCSVRKHAEDRERSFLGKLEKIKSKKDSKIIVLGCFVEKAKNELKKQFKHIDLFIGPLEYEYLPEILKNELNLQITNSKIHLNIFNNVSCFVPIMTGCNNFCSYCIVPYLRGRETSRSVNDILEEVKFLLDNGVKEIILIGQNVNSYRWENNEKDIITFAKLLEKIANLDQNKKYWVRFLTNHPKDMVYDIVNVIKSYNNIARHIHLPLQSGSNKILELMNRNYTIEKYKKIVEMIRKELPEVSITTDLIVGFPYETDEDFQQTIQAVKEIQFDAAFVFKYSPREGTKAALLSDNVPQEIKEKRHYELLSLCDTIASQKNKMFIGKEIEVLIVSQTVKKWKNFYIGKTLNNKTVEIEITKEELIGNFIKTKIKNTKLHTLIGEIE